MPVKFPNWFRIAWWLAILGATSYFLWRRYPDLVGGRSCPVDVFVFLIWVGLLLVPLFQEVNFFGIKLKQQIKEAKEELKQQILSLKADIHNNVDARSQLNQTIYTSPPDWSLPGIEQQVKRAVAQALAARHGAPTPQQPDIKAPEDNAYLFSVRLAIETELRRIHALPFPDIVAKRKEPLSRIIESLLGDDILTPDLASALREVYAVCTPAIHGEKVTTAKLQFVRDVAPDLIGTLKLIQPGN